MGYWVVSGLLIVLALSVLLLLDYFGNRKKFAWYSQLTLFIAWLFPFSIIVILPLDLASTLFRKCLEEGKEKCEKPIAYVEESFLYVFWTTLYWTMFNLTWFVIPLMQSWVRSGEFQIIWRFIYAVKDYLVYYAIVGAVGVAFLIYVIVAKIFTTPGDLLAFAMAGANAWGLLLVTIMLGYGLIEVPRGLWYNASVQWYLRYLEFQAPRTKEAMVDAEAELYEVAREIALAAKRIDEPDILRPYVEKLLKLCPLAADTRPYDDEEQLPDMSYTYLKSLHERIKRAIGLKERTQAQYEFLLRKAFLLQDIIANEKNADKSMFISVKEDRLTVISIDWWWYLILKPMLMRIAAVLSAIATLALVWSESTFQFNNTSDVTLSIPALILQDARYLTLHVVSTSFVLYMCVCAYSSLFKVKIFDIYELVPQHHSDEGSLLFIGAYLCRLTFPICYNFLNMVGDDENSVFAKYQGKNVNLAPLLGEGYNRWLPMVILVYCILTLLNLHGRILRLFKMKNYFYESISSQDEDTEEGRNILDQARKIEERKMSQDPFINYSSVGLGGVSNNSRTGKGASQGSSTKEFLERYKRGEIGSSKRSNNVEADSDRVALLGSRFSSSSDTSDGRLSFDRSPKEKISNVFGKTTGTSKKDEQRKFERMDDNESQKSRKFGVGSSASSTSPATQRSQTKGVALGDAPQTFKLGAFGASSKQNQDQSDGGSKKPKGPPSNLFSDI
ncbi:LMBR1 domain-containing protein 2 [Nowakowskiella sp. JEL0407]|nr:LMBR1 domain-containing protein 2 [Nowakowskiella sp. JEL0407]